MTKKTSAKKVKKGSKDKKGNKAEDITENLLIEIEDKARNHDYDIAFLLDWTQKFTKEINTCSPEELTRGLLALAKLEYFDEEFLESINQQVKQEINKFNIQEISHCLRCFAKLGYYSEEFIDKFKQIFYASKDQAFHEDLSNIIWGMSKLKYHDEGFFAEWSEKAIERMDSFSPVELSKTILSVAKLGYYSDNFINRWIEQAKTKSFSKQGLSNSAFALTMLMKNNDLPEAQKEEIKNLIIGLTRQINPALVTKTEEKRQLSSIFYAMDGAAREDLPHIRDRLNAWEKEIKKDSLISISPSQHKIFNFVKTQDKAAKEEYWIKEIGTYVDIYVPSTNCVFQVDGKTHFYANDNVQDAATRFNTAMVSQHASLSRITNFHDYERDIKRTLKAAQYKTVELKEQKDNTVAFSNTFSSLEVEEEGDTAQTLQSASVPVAAPETSKRERRKESEEKKRLLEADEKFAINQAIEEKEKVLAEIERKEKAEEDRAKSLNKTLVEKYIEINATKLRNKSPLMLAVEEGSAKWVERILREGFIPKEADEALDAAIDKALGVNALREAFYDAITKEDLAVIQEFLSYDKIRIGPPASRRNTICNEFLAFACIDYDNPKLLQSLIARKLVDPNFKRSGNITLLGLACALEKGEVVEILLNGGANPNKLFKQDSVSPLYAACQENSSQVVQMLLENGAKPNMANHDKSTPLLTACINRNEEAIKLLLKFGANPNVVDEYGRSVLYVAAAFGYTELVDRIIKDKKVSVDITTEQSEGATPLIVATQMNHMDVVKSLVNSGANMEIKNEQGASALTIAAEEGQREAVRMFLNKFADPDIPFEEEGMTYTPLILSVGQKEIGIVKDLLAAGANINAGFPRSAKAYAEPPRSAKAYAEYRAEEVDKALKIYEEIEKFEGDPVKYIVEYDQPIELKLKALDRLSKQEITPEITAEMNKQKTLLETMEKILEDVSQNKITTLKKSSTGVVPPIAAKHTGKSMGR